MAMLYYICVVMPIKMYLINVLTILNGYEHCVVVAAAKAVCLYRFFCIIYIVKYLIIDKRQYCGTINALDVIS